MRRVPDRPWMIKDNKEYVSFWEYVIDNSDAEGFMPKRTDPQIGRMLRLRKGEAHDIIELANKRFLSAFKKIVGGRYD